MLSEEGLGVAQGIGAGLACLQAFVKLRHKHSGALITHPPEAQQGGAGILKVVTVLGLKLSASVRCQAVVT